MRHSSSPPAQTGHGDADKFIHLLGSAGFSDIRAEVMQKQGETTIARARAIGLIEGFPMVDFIKARDPALVPVAIDTLTKALSKHQGDAPVRAPISALVTSATAPGA